MGLQGSVCGGEGDEGEVEVAGLQYMSVPRPRHDDMPSPGAEAPQLPPPPPHLSGMRAEGKSVHAARLPELVEGVEVGVDVVGIVAVRAVVLAVPLGGRRAVLGGATLRLALVVHHVKSNDLEGNKRRGRGGHWHRMHYGLPRTTPSQASAVCTPHLGEQHVQLGVSGGVLGDLKQRLKDVVQHLLEVLDHARLLVDVVQPRDLEDVQVG